MKWTFPLLYRKVDFATYFSNSIVTLRIVPVNW